MLQEKFRVFNQLVLSSHKQNLIDHKAKNVNLYHAYCFFSFDCRSRYCPLIRFQTNLFLIIYTYILIHYQHSYV